MCAHFFIEFIDIVSNNETLTVFISIFLLNNCKERQEKYTRNRRKNAN